MGVARRVQLHQQNPFCSGGGRLRCAHRQRRKTQDLRYRFCSTYLSNTNLALCSTVVPLIYGYRCHFGDLLHFFYIYNRACGDRVPRVLAAAVPTLNDNRHDFRQRFQHALPLVQGGRCARARGPFRGQRRHVRYSGHSLLALLVPKCKY